MTKIECTPHAGLVATVDGQLATFAIIGPDGAIAASGKHLADLVCDLVEEAFTARIRGHGHAPLVREVPEAIGQQSETTGV